MCSTSQQTLLQEDSEDEEGLQTAAMEALPIIATAIGSQHFGPLWQRFAEEGAVRLCQPAVPSSLRLMAIGVPFFSRRSWADSLRSLLQLRV